MSYKINSKSELIEFAIHHWTEANSYLDFIDVKEIYVLKRMRKRSSTISAREFGKMRVKFASPSGVA